MKHSSSSEFPMSGIAQACLHVPLTLESERFDLGLVHIVKAVASVYRVVLQMGLGHHPNIKLRRRGHSQWGRNSWERGETLRWYLSQKVIFPVDTIFLSWKSYFFKSVRPSHPVLWPWTFCAMSGSQWTRPQSRMCMVESLLGENPVRPFIIIIITNEIQRCSDCPHERCGHSNEQIGRLKCVWSSEWVIFDRRNGLELELVWVPLLITNCSLPVPESQFLFVRLHTCLSDFPILS